MWKNKKVKIVALFASILNLIRQVEWLSRINYNVFQILIS